MDERREFTLLFEETRSPVYRQRCQVMQENWERDCETMWRTRNKRKKKIPSLSVMTESDPEIQAEFERRKVIVNAMIAEEAARRDARKARMTELAKVLPVLPSNEPRMVGAVSEGEYRSMGFSASKYAEQAAEHIAGKYRSAGVSAEVRDVFIKYDSPIRTAGGWTSTGYHQFQIWARVDEVNKAILDLKPDTRTLREWVKSCWGNGVNPRVYNPFLPHGYEEENGLNYYGNDIRRE